MIYVTCVERLQIWQFTAHIAGYATSVHPWLFPPILLTELESALLSLTYGAVTIVYPIKSISVGDREAVSWSYPTSYVNINCAPRHRNELGTYFSLSLSLSLSPRPPIVRLGPWTRAIPVICHHINSCPMPTERKSNKGMSYHVSAGKV